MDRSIHLWQEVQTAGSTRRGSVTGSALTSDLRYELIWSKFWLQSPIMCLDYNIATHR